MVNFKPEISITGALVTTWIFTSIEIAVVALRLYIQWFIKRSRFNLSDYLVLLALVIAVSGSSVITWSLSVSRGLAASLPNFNAPLLETYLKTVVVWTLLYQVTLYAVKASLLALYRVVFRQLVGQTRVNLLFWVSALYLFSCFIVSTFTTLFACGKVSNQWVDWPHVCEDGQKLWYFIILAVMGLTTDVMIMIIPLILIHMIPASKSSRRGAFFVIAIGGISIIANAVRTAGVGPTVSGRILNFEDALQVIRTIEFWSNLEWMFAFIASCLPSYRILLREETPMGSRLSHIRKLLTRNRSGNDSHHSESLHPERRLNQEVPSLPSLNASALDESKVEHGDPGNYQ